MKKIILACWLAGASAVGPPLPKTPIPPPCLPAWITRPLSLADCLNIALQQNGTILKAKSDLEAQQGVVVQTRAVALPQLTADGQYKDTDRSAIENFPNAFPARRTKTGMRRFNSSNPSMKAGKLVAAFKAATATKKQAIAQFQTVRDDTLLAVRLAYYDVLLAAQQITVNQASVELLQQELDDQQRRYAAGTVPKLNVLRAEVALANQRPALIQAQNSYRTSKNNLSICSVTICPAQSGRTFPWT